MPFPLEADTVSHGIQLSVAPVFFLTAVSGMIGAVAQRLARIIDRARVIEEILKAGAGEDEAARLNELAELRKRGLLSNSCIALLTLCAFLIGLTIVALFVSETIDLQIQRLSVFSFLFGVVCFLLALLCFMAETWIATRLLNFGRGKRRVAAPR